MRNNNLINFVILPIIFITTFVILCYIYLYNGEIGKSDRELVMVAGKGQIVIDALEEYKKDKGEYPVELTSLYPVYISNDVDLRYRFTYTHGDRVMSGNYTKDEIKEWGGYELELLNSIKEWGFPISITPRSFYSFIYRPSKLYPERKWIKPKKRVKDWALIIRYRRYHSSVNPIVGPGV